MSQLSKQDKNALDEFKKKLADSSKYDLPNLILFGSKARGNARKNSDLDLLIIFKKLTPQKRWLVSDLATEIFLEREIDISPHVYSKKEYEDFLKLQTPFTLSIKKEGITV
ncbi:hypothetical protein A2Y83_04490 [Candidatus Falkowbacteria bacterium RBG_13_39_14]|uniref:Polymerase nucleotidyl transferase domain-containing protein n=1 Tax=Candidatus Falkowbacteria bacterium RBG_13_39_14 TaxID=1797985 RepID=A0A1F5S496_9BACT|nr:MAG: hypothetical protein A2Y83_04490 [Candidatus Falkowbacteria bacterium RBG_13_39_14]